MVNISTYKLQVVKEKGGRYDIDNKSITSPKQLFKIATEVLEMAKLAEEMFSIVTLDNKLKITGVFVVSIGTLNASIVHPREVFKRALLQNASSVALMHNHPSGNPQPSKDDINITKRLIKAGEILGIEIIDHIIVGDCSYTSLKENEHI